MKRSFFNTRAVAVTTAFCLALAATIAHAPPRAAAQWPAPRALEAERLQRAGLRVIEGQHLRLVTDLPSSPAVDELPQVVDAAVDQWADYFRVPREKQNDWRVQAYLIGKLEPFDALGLMPVGHDQFPHGLSMGYEVWLHEQPSDYYRRHLLLHEVTHSFMSTMLGGCGPGWYMEGIAEMLGTHDWDAAGGALKLGVMPASREAVPMWGRMKAVRDAFVDNRALSVPSVMQIDNRQILGDESYAWVWALAKWLDTHPRYRERFRAMSNHVQRDDFNDLLRESYRDDWDELQLEWQQFIAALEYAHDIEREAFSLAAPRPLSASGAEVFVAANRGWQSTGYRVEAGRTYELTADGRFVIGREPDGTPWPCEANGVTLEYHAGRPLGILLAAIDPGGDSSERLAAFTEPIAVGLGTKLVAPQNGVLWLRVNDSPARLGENEGELRVLTIRQ
ncbi:MAG: hypothetical protein WD851_07030 [Pirellulales bacterium]